MNRKSENWKCKARKSSKWYLGADPAVCADPVRSLQVLECWFSTLRPPKGGGGLQRRDTGGNHNFDDGGNRTYDGGSN